MILGLFGYYPWHYGVLYFLDFLDLGLETLAYVGDFVTLIDILSGVLEVYLKTLGCLFVLYTGYCDYILLFVIWNSPVYNCYSAQFLWRLNTLEVWFS